MLLPNDQLCVQNKLPKIEFYADLHTGVLLWQTRVIGIGDMLMSHNGGLNKAIKMDYYLKQLYIHVFTKLPLTRPKQISKDKIFIGNWWCIRIKNKDHWTWAYFKKRGEKTKLTQTFYYTGMPYANTILKS